MVDRQLRVGDWVEVLTFPEIAATLDEKGRLGGLPFMPEMIAHCGQRFQVVKSAHKTCDPTGCMNMLRMPDAVHLNTRCDGSAHDGCEARCQFFWKTAWLKRAQGPSKTISSAGSEMDEAAEARLCAATRYMTENGIRYCCQATEIIRATDIISPKDIRQYLQDIRSRNVAVPFFIRHFSLAILKTALSKLTKWFRRPSAVQTACAIVSPEVSGAECEHYQAGEYVRVRSAKEIKATLGRKRGPALEPEMLRHCGRTHRILCHVSRIIDERSGKMLKLAKDCVVLEGITCAGLDNSARLFCPRSCYYFWREAWLQRADGRSPYPLRSADSKSKSPIHSESDHPSAVLADDFNC